MNNNTKKIAIALTVGFLISGTFIINKFNKKSNNTTILEDLKQKSFYTLNYSKDGDLSIFDLKNNSVIDKYELKKLLKEMPKNIQKINNPIGSETYNGFEKVKVRIKKGDNVWSIQKSLTPSENIIKMLQMVQKINKGVKLHPVYPNQELYFLKGRTGNTNKEIKPVEKPTILNPEYIYSYSNDLTTLYACEINTKNFYKVVQNNNKIAVETIAENTNFKNIDEFKIENNEIFVLDKENKKFYKLSDNKLNSIDAENIKDWEVLDGEIFYIANDKYIYKLDKNFKRQTIEVGDITNNLVVIKDKLYALNIFGKGKGKNVVFEISPRDFKVLGWYQLNSDKKNIILEGDTNNIYVYQEKVEANELNRYLIMGELGKFDSLKENNIKNISLDGENIKIKDNYIFLYQNGKFMVYEINSMNKVFEFNNFYEQFIPIVK